MQSSDFNQYFDKFPFLKHHFLGIFSIDNLPKSIPLRKFLICNTDFSSGDGIHWFCFVKSNNNFIELFDSLGVTQTKKELIQNYCKFKTKKLIYNETQFQDSLSNTCGKFCIYFLIKRLFNFDTNFEDLLEDIFSTNVNKNETNVNKFCSDILTI